jgi:hypothetical protein
MPKGNNMLGEIKTINGNDTERLGVIESVLDIVTDTMSPQPGICTMNALQHYLRGG